MSENRYPAASRLSLEIGAANGRSVLSRARFTAPFKVTSPFYDALGRMTVMLISVSAGIMAGDRQEVEVVVREGAEALVTSQAFEKIHKMDGDSFACRSARFRVGSNASLSYAPLPAIPFAGSSFRCDTHIDLADGSSRLFLADIIACGRVSRGERFAFREYAARTQVFQGGELVFAENADYLPGEMDLEGFCLFEGYTHAGSLLMVNWDFTEDRISAIRDAVNALPGGVGGMTRIGQGGFCVRALCNGSEQLLGLHDEVRKILSDAG